MSPEESGTQAAASHWRALLAAVCVAQATAVVGFDFTLPFIPLYLQHDLGIHGLGQTALWAGLIGFGPAIPATIFGPMWGRLADRFGYRTMLLRAMVSASVLLACMGLAGSPWALLGLRMTQGALTGTIFASQALVASVVPEKETGRAMGLLQMSVFVGATFGPVGGGAVADLLGYRMTYVFAGVLLAAATAIVYAWVREPVRRIREAGEPAERVPLRSVLLIPSFFVALVLTLVIQLAGTALFPVLPLYVQDLVHSAGKVAADTGWLMALSGLAAGAGSYLSGRLQRRLGLKPLLAVSIAFSSVLLAAQALVPSYTALLLVRAAYSITFGALVGLVGMLAAISSPAKSKGAAFGMVGAASSLGFGAGPLVGGALTAAIGIRPLFVIAAGVLGVTPLAIAMVAVSRPAIVRLALGMPGLRTLLER